MTIAVTMKKLQPKALHVSLPLFLIGLVLPALTFAQDNVMGKGVQGGFVDPVKTAKSSQWLNQLPKYEKNRITYYDAQGVPSAGVRAQQSIDLTKWCNYPADAMQQWKQQWDKEYKGKVTAGCANLYLEWQKARACQQNPDKNVRWKPNTNWQGANKQTADLPNGSVNGLLATKKCVQCNLNLVGLSCLNLRAVNFSRSILKRMDFYQADLSGANFSGSQLTESVLTASNLHHANLQGAKIAKSVLSNAMLENANLSHALLANVDLQRANLKNANFSHSTLRNISLSNADLRGANFTGAILENVDLSGAKVANTEGLYLRKPK